MAFLYNCYSSHRWVRSKHHHPTPGIPGWQDRRPDHIIVYNFAATPADVSADSVIAGQYSEHSTPQTAEQIATGRQVGAEIVKVLVEDIRGMGLPILRGSSSALG